MVAGQAVAQSVFKSTKQGPHETRIGAVAHLGLSKHGVFGSDGNMRKQRKPRAGAHGPAVDGADDRFGKLP